MSIFNISFVTLIKHLLPVALRQTVQRAWLRVLVAPVIYLHTLRIVYRDNNLYDLAHNGQVCHLSAVLNDVWDSSLKRIYIDGPFPYLPIWVFLDVELSPVPLALDSEVGTIVDYEAPVYLYTDTETLLSGTDFFIHVPVSITYDAARLAALVNKYKLPGKSWQVVTF